MKSRFGNTTVVLLGVIPVFLTLLIFELALRWLQPINMNGISLHLKQDVAGLHQEIHYERDAMGLRRLTLDPSVKRSQSVRVLCIGASTTDQPTQETDNTWCGLLQLKLAEHFQSSNIVVETVSFAQGGWRVADLLARTPRVLDTLKPDIVTILMGINDLAFNGGPDYVYRGIEDRVTTILQREVASKRGFWNQCEARSHICQRAILMWQKIHEWRHRQDGRSLEWHSRNLPNLRKDYQNYRYAESLRRDPDPLLEFQDGMDALLKLLVSRQIEAIVLGQPVLWKQNMDDNERSALWFSVETPTGRVRPSGQWLIDEMKRFNVAQQAVAKKYGVRYIDLDARVPKDLDHYFDDCHFTDIGSLRMAKEVLPEVVEAIKARMVGPKRIVNLSHLKLASL